ncbi:MAG: Hsp20/alpha crystallin family protein [Anaerolineales bacterium]
MTYYIPTYRRMINPAAFVNRSVQESKSTNHEFNLPINVQALEDGYLVTSMVAGLDTQDVTIEILKNTLTLRGEFKAKDSDYQYLRNELPEGKFSRTLTFPTDLDAGKTKAEIKNGLLSIHIPKSEEHRPKSIKVKASL